MTEKVGDFTFERLLSTGKDRTSDTIRTTKLSRTVYQLRTWNEQLTYLGRSVGTRCLILGSDREVWVHLYHGELEESIEWESRVERGDKLLNPRGYTG